MSLPGYRFALALGGVIIVGLLALMMIGPCTPVPAEGDWVVPSVPKGLAPMTYTRGQYVSLQVDDVVRGNGTATGVGTTVSDTGGNNAATTSNGNLVVTGTVEGYDGSKLVGVDVEIATDRGTRIYRTDETGKFKGEAAVPDGRVIIRVPTPPAGYRTGGETLFATRGETVNVRIVLQAAASLVIHVYDSDVAPVQGAQVSWALQTGFYPDPNGAGGEYRGRQVQAAVTNEEGMARFTSLSLGLFRLTTIVRAPGRQPQYLVDFLRIEEEREYSFEFHLPQAHSLTLRLLDPVGTPIVNVRPTFRVLQGPLQSTPPPSIEGVTNRDGEVVANGMIEGRYVALLEVPNLPQATVTIDMPYAGAFIVNFEAGSTLLVRATDASSGKPIELRMVRLTYDDEDQGRLYSGGASEEKGYMAVSRLRSGRATATVAVTGFETVSQAVQLYPDQPAMMDVSLESLGGGQDVEVLVVMDGEVPVEGAVVSLVMQARMGNEDEKFAMANGASMAQAGSTDANGGDASGARYGGAARTDVNGIAVIRNVLPGTYTVRASKAGVGDGAVYDFEVEAGRAAGRVTVELGGGAEARITVTDGTGAAFNNADVVLRRADGLLLRAIRSAEAEGLYIRRSVPPGTYEIVLAPTFAAAAADAPSAGSLSIGASAARKEVSIRVPTTVARGTAVAGGEPATGGSMLWYYTPTGSISEHGGPYCRQASNVPVMSDGSFVCGPLPRGRYLVQLESAGRLYRAVVTLGSSGPGEIQFTEPPSSVGTERRAPMIMPH